MFIKVDFFFYWFYIRSEEPGTRPLDDSLIKSEERKKSEVSLGDADHQTFELEENKYPNHKQDGTESSQKSAGFGSSELGQSTKCEVFKWAEKWRSSVPEHSDQAFQIPNFDLSKGTPKSGGHQKEESAISERSQEETDGAVKDSTAKRTCCTPESANGQSSDACKGGSVHICQVQTVEPTGTLKVRMSNLCSDVFCVNLITNGNNGVKINAVTFFSNG